MFHLDCRFQTQKSRIGLPQLEATFDTIVEAFVFFDRNKDGYVSKEDLVDAINRSSPGRQGDKIGLERFGKHSIHNQLVYCKAVNS